MDYSRLRAAALQGGEDEEAVTVDTRALIDKVLARYSGEWTTLRELIQNAADAQATTVTVKWETLPSTSVPLPTAPSRSDILKHTIANHTLRRLVVQNDGQPFTKTDWGRLKRIAEGNPDETKIGAFGVGFYSVFADCEEPFVSSGNEAMAFYWKGNALFTKKSIIPAEQATRHTAFVLDYRNTTTPVPNLLSVSQFLATSLTFVALQTIEFWIDDYKVLSLQKKSSPSVALPLPRDLEAKTKEGLMKVTEVDRTSTQIDATFMTAIGWKPKSTASSTKPESYGAPEAPSLRSFFARLTTSSSQSALKTKAQNEENAAQVTISEDVTQTGSSTIFLRATSASIRTSVSASFASELERATKKPPPKTTKLSILTSSYDESQASGDAAVSGAVGKATDVFASVLPNKKPGGRIFIGFPTMQTTGAGMHVSAPSVIPTVEREAIDLNARWVRTWNVELLRAAGIITRLAFANEMEDLNQKLRRLADKSGSISKDIVIKHIPEAIHTLRNYTFGDSTPSGQVGQIIEEAFWTCFRRASIEVYSSLGVLQTSKVRLGSEELSKFVSSIPVVPNEIKDVPFVKKLIDFGLISHITVTDIKTELEAKSLDKTQLIHFISWAGKKSRDGELDPGSRQTLLDVAVATVGEGADQGEIIALGSIQNYSLTSKIPAAMPLPPTTIPVVYTAASSQQELQALGWEPLGYVPWLRFLLETSNSRVEEQSITRSPKFAVQVLTVLSKGWDSMNSNSQSTITNLLQAHTVMPTKLGMKKPTDSYLPTVKLFDDLPLVENCEKLKPKFMSAIGVRKTVDLDTIFTRLLNPAAETGHRKWSHLELIKYLTSVQADIPAADLKKLEKSRFCPAEGGPKGVESTKPTDTLYRVCDLFEPKDSLRVLGLPLLQWPGPPGSFRSGGPEGRFLSSLGLRAHPTVPELVDMMASKDENLRSAAMTYFITNHYTNRYGAFDLSGSTKAILPIKGSARLVAPNQCFTNERASILGFDILKSGLYDHATKFGDRDAATAIFGYFASRLPELGETSVSKLRGAPIVPVVRAAFSDKGKSSISYITPFKTYLGTSSTYGDIFDFVDFGTDANLFLSKCGAKTEPTKLEVARMACAEPARLLSTLQTPEKYLELLKSLAEAIPNLRKDKDLWKSMKSSPFLLAYKEIAATKGALVEVDDEDEAPIRQYQLALPAQIVTVDDIISFRLFKDQLLCAPEDDLLESFYLQLGASPLSSIVQEEIRIGPRSQKPQGAELLRKHVVERSKIFLFEYANYRRDSIKHDSKWLEKNLRVETVRSVALRRTLRGNSRPHTEKRSAAGEHAGGAWTLYVAEDGKPDMYQVGQAICQMILNRPNQQAYLFFEPFLTLDLYGLRARGYNVDRILRAKAAEARIAEENRRKALEEEQQRIQERENAWAGQNALEGDRHPKAIEAGREAPPTPQSNPVMPGSWESPEQNQSELSRLSKSSRSFFSDLGRRFGLDTPDQSESQKQLQQFVDQPSEGGPSGGHAGNDKAKAPQNNDGRVTSPAVVQQNLLNAVKATRAHGSDSVFSEPQVNEVKEQATYCDSKPAHNITFAAEASNGMKVYVSKDMSTDAATFLNGNIGAINAFAAILLDIGSVYALSPKVLHIFYDEKGGTIAFNTGGSIFCNFRFFLQLHAGRMTGEGKVEAATWWWVVLAHELAHNLVSTHNSDHSYYTESFIQQYFAKMVAKTAEYLRGAVPPPRTRADAPPPYAQGQ
ncbi:hypothetical protein NLU13_9462 [Sarocladium strictum]|uniref:Sacsin/Nov domain-containing protein n=1 Tax=Sarocladium strictum TaxID=5046 RepID=A0AA39L3V9_SARSR|nr:hypothetical protein NLU13_9462 [Sarocladium strictum]